MTFVALLMRPWVAVKKTMQDASVYIPADDVLIKATGVQMANAAAEAYGDQKARLKVNNVKHKALKGSLESMLKNMDELDEAQTEMERETPET